MTRVNKIVKGQTFVCLHPILQEPIRGKVIALTSNETKQIGLELEADVGLHDCDGRGKDGHCIWVRPHHIMTEEEYAAELESRKAAEELLAASVLDDLEELEL